MRRVASPLAFLALVALAPSVPSLASCMFFRSLDELSQSHGTSSGEAGAMSGAEGGTDGGGASDAQTGADQSAPATDATIDVERPSPCVDATVTLCDDFDTARDAGWTVTTLGAGAEAEPTTTRATSKPNGLTFFLPRAAASSPQVLATREKVVQGSFAKAHAEFDVWVEPTDYQSGDVGFGLLALLFRNDASQAGAVFFLTKDQSVLSVEKGSADYYDAPLVPPSRWVHVTLDVEPGQSVTLDLDGANTVKSVPVLVAGANPRFQLSFGLHGWNSPRPPQRVYVDNFVLDLK